MARFKSYEYTQASSAREVGFHLRYLSKSGEVLIDEDFECVPVQPALARALWSGHMPNSDDGVTVIDIILACLTSEDEFKFKRVLDRKDFDVPAKDLWGIANDLAEAYSDRPTKSSDNSANGLSASPDSSEPSSPSTA